MVVLLCTYCIITVATTKLLCTLFFVNYLHIVALLQLVKLFLNYFFRFVLQAGEQFLLDGPLSAVVDAETGDKQRGHEKPLSLAFLKIRSTELKKMYE